MDEFLRDSKSSRKGPSSANLHRGTRAAGLATLEIALGLFEWVLRFLHLMSGPSREGRLSSELFKAGLELGIFVIVENWDTKLILS